VLAKVLSSQRHSLALALEEIKERIEDQMGDPDFILFALHPHYNYEDINHLVRKVFRTKNYAGFHSLSSFENDKVISGLVMCFLKFERKGKASVYVVEDIEEKGALEKTAEYLNQHSNKLHILVGGLCGHKLGFFLEELAQLLKYFPINNIVGGLSSGYTKGDEVLTYQFMAGKVVKNGFFILTLDNVEFDLRVALGFKPYGITYTVRSAKGYRVYTVDDGIKFSYVVKSFLKHIGDDNIKHLWFCPITVLDDQKGYVATMRTFKDIKEDYVEFFGPIKEGQHFKLSFATEEELLAESRKAAYEAKRVIKYPDIVFDFSCLARQYVLGEFQQREPEIYTNILDSPLFGFFTYGEVGPDKLYKKLKFYNQTSLLLSIKEL